MGASPRSRVVSEEREARRRKRREDYRRAERLYQEVRRSLEEHKQFQEAHRFAYRELEMRRLAYLAGRGHWWKRLWSGARANVLSFEALYHQLSSYGESWRKPLFCLLLSVLVAFPLVYALPDLVSVPVGHRFDPLDLSLATAALLPTPEGIELTPLARVAQVVERVWSPFLAFLVGLAVRRRFRRQVNFYVNLFPGSIFGARWRTRPAPPNARVAAPWGCHSITIRFWF